MKTWRGNEHTDDLIIAYTGDAIYKINPKETEVDQYIADFYNGILPVKNFFAIPLHYIKEIRLQEGKKYIEVFFGQDSTEHLHLADPYLRNEVFHYFTQNIPGGKYSIDKYSTWKKIKKPVIAMLVIVVLFLWSLNYAIDFDKGVDYEITNGHYNSLTGIVLAIASYGVRNVIIFFGILLLIALTAIMVKVRKKVIINSITIGRTE